MLLYFLRPEALQASLLLVFFLNRQQGSEILNETLTPGTLISCFSNFPEGI